MDWSFNKYANGQYTFDLINGEWATSDISRNQYYYGKRLKTITYRYINKLQKNGTY
jgi:hypothetical protein